MSTILGENSAGAAPRRPRSVAQAGGSGVPSLPRVILGLVGLFVVSLNAFAQTPYPDPADQAAWPGKGPIRVHPWMKDNRASFWKKREADQGAVVFVGSSMIANWKTLAKDLPELKVANRGIGGDVSRGLLFRFQEDVLDLQPRAIVLAIGSNDLSAHTDPAIIVENIETMVDQARAAQPHIPILLCPVSPRDGASAPLKPGAREDLNARLVELGKKKGLPVLDLQTPFADAEGKPIAELYAKDRIHFSAEGYRKFAEVMRKQLAEMGQL
jgi:lysophospholipase L1-like esterase